MHRGRRTTGFTLLEVLVAVAITATIGAGAVQLLRGIIDARQQVTVRSEQLAVLQRFTSLVALDVEQYINRSIRNEYGDFQASLLLDSGDYPIEFTRAGWRNRPGAEDPRSELMRVAYRTESIEDDQCAAARRRLASWGMIEPEHDCLVRYVWPVLDRSYESEPTSMVVLDQIEEFSVEIITHTDDSSGGVQTGLQTHWPIVQASSGDPEIPVALTWKLTLPALGEIERTWLIAHDGEF